MTGFDELHLPRALGDALEARGWSAHDPFVREAVPAAARGNNVVAVAPPAAVYATPVLAAALGRADRLLILAPAAELAMWAAITQPLGATAGRSVLAARTGPRATRRLRRGGADIVLADPETALGLVRGSVLAPAEFTAVVLGWVERLDVGDTLTELMHEIPRDAQRLVFTATPERVADLVERYARKGLTVRSGSGLVPAPVPSGAPPRIVSVGWERRAAALADVVEMLDPATVCVWALDRAEADAIGRALPVGTPGVELVTGDAPDSDLVIAFDPPDSERFVQLRDAGSLVLLAPPGTEAYLARMAPAARPLRLPGVLEGAASAAAARRAEIAAAIDNGDASTSLLTLAPLLERYDATRVAAALYDLWSTRAAPAAPAAAPGGGAPSQPARIWVGIGKSEGVSPNDFVGLMTKELRVPRASIGRIELRDAYSLIEVPAAEAEAIARALNGATVRRKRLTARIDRESGARQERPPRRRAPR